MPWKFWFTLIEVLDLEKHSLFNLKNHQPDIDKLYLYAKGPYEAKYQLLIVAFIEYSNDMDDIIILLKNTMKVKNVNIC